MTACLYQRSLMHQSIGRGGEGGIGVGPPGTGSEGGGGDGSGGCGGSGVIPPGYPSVPEGTPRGPTQYVRPRMATDDAALLSLIRAIASDDWPDASRTLEASPPTATTALKRGATRD